MSINKKTEGILAANTSVASTKTLIILTQPFDILINSNEQTSHKLSRLVETNCYLVTRNHITTIKKEMHGEIDTKTITAAEI